MTFRALILTIALLALTVAPAQARFDGRLATSMTAMVVAVDENGRETLTPAQEAAPGEVVEYQITYTNLTQAPLTGFNVTGPVPTDTTYVGRSAVGAPGAALEVTIDGGETWEREPVTRWRRDETGRIVRVTIPPTEYTAVRWVGGDLHPGRSALYTYRVAVK